MKQWVEDLHNMGRFEDVLNRMERYIAHLDATKILSENLALQGFITSKEVLQKDGAWETELILMSGSPSPIFGIHKAISYMDEVNDIALRRIALNVIAGIFPDSDDLENIKIDLILRRVVDNINRDISSHGDEFAVYDQIPKEWGKASDSGREDHMTVLAGCGGSNQKWSEALVSIPDRISDVATAITNLQETLRSINQKEL